MRKYTVRDQKVGNAVSVMFILVALLLDVTLISFIPLLNVFNWYGLLLSILVVIINLFAYLLFLKSILYTRKYIIFDSENQKIIQIYKHKKDTQTKSFLYKDIIGYKNETANKISAQNARQYDTWFPYRRDVDTKWLEQGYIEIAGDRYICIITSFSRRRVQKELKKIKQIIEEV